MVEKNRSEPPIEVRRIRQRRKVSLFVGNTKTPTIGHAANLSMSGMFVEISNPPAAKTVLRFEMVVAGGFRVIRGRAQVVWVRGATAAEPAGLGLRFYRLDPTDARLLRGLVEEEISRQDTTGAKELRDAVELTKSKSAPTLVGADTKHRPFRRPSRSKSIFVLITLGAVVVVTALLVVPSALHESRSLSDLIRERFSSSANADEAGPGDPSSVARQWARAWSRQRPEEHLALYSRNFRTAGTRRLDWEDERRRRISRGEPIEIGSVTITRFEDNQAELRFEHHPAARGDSHSARIIRWLLIVEDTRWKILEERIDP